MDKKIFFTPHKRFELYHSSLFIDNMSTESRYRKQYGDMRNLYSEGLKACAECRKYIQKRKTVHNDFNIAWPAVIWTYLWKTSSKNIVSRLIASLPIVLKLQWQKSTDQMSGVARLEFSRAATVETRDGSFIYDLFRSLEENPMRNMLQGRWEFLLNVFRCPAGCHKYIDDKLELVSLKHYIGWIDEDFRSFEPDGRHFYASRPDWPRESVTFFGTHVNPTIIRNAQHGISFLTCHRSIHAMHNADYVHVPKNPVMSGPLLQPFPFAPLVTSANIIRNEQVHAHNASFRVVRQIGTSAGLSTFSLAKENYHHHPLSEDLRNITNVILNERNDILEHMRATKTPEVIGSIKSFQGDLPSQKKIHECKKSGTFIEVDDAVQEAQALFFNRSQGSDTQAVDDDGGYEKEYVMKDKIKDCLTNPRNVVLPTDNTAVSSHRVYLFPNWNHGFHTRGIRTHLICMCLGNSRKLHRNFVEGCWKGNLLSANRQRVVERIGYILQQSRQGKRLKTKLIYASVHLCESKMDITASTQSYPSNDQIIAQKEGVHFTAAQFLQDVCRRTVHLNCLDTGGMDLRNIENLIVTTEYVSRGSFENIPSRLHSGQFELVIAARLKRMLYTDSGNTYKCEVLLRWEKDRHWVCIIDGKKNDDGKHWNLDGTLKGTYNFLLYASKEDERMRLEYQDFNFMGGQDIAWCECHDIGPLIREGPNPVDWVPCCYDNCNLHSIYRCSWNMRERQFQCHTGICRKHFKEVSKQNTRIFLSPQNTVGCRRNGNTDRNDPVDSSDESSQSDISSDSISDTEKEEDMEFIRNMSFVETTDVQLEENQTRQLNPAFEPNSHATNNIKSSYILNNLFQVMSRHRNTRTSPLHMQNLLQSVYSTNEESRTPTLFLEGELFPHIFPFEHQNSIVGALPHSFFINPILRRKGSGLGSLLDHIRVRSSDQSLLTSVEPDYIAWQFDILMNFLINFNTIPLAIRKGPEFLKKSLDWDGITIKKQENQMMLDVVESRGPVNELAAMIRDQGMWSYFITLTCNDELTPGVSQIYKHVMNFRVQTSDIYEQVQAASPERRMRIVASAAPVLLQAWMRYIKFFWIWLVNGPDCPLGSIKAHWWR